MKVSLLLGRNEVGNFVVKGDKKFAMPPLLLLCTMCGWLGMLLSGKQKFHVMIQ